MNTNKHLYIKFDGDIIPYINLYTETTIYIGNRIVVLNEYDHH